MSFHLWLITYADEISVEIKELDIEQHIVVLIRHWQGLTNNTIRIQLVSVTPTNVIIGVKLASYMSVVQK